MKCHYFTDKGTGIKTLIPGCWSVVHSYNKEDCTCVLPVYEGSNENFKIVEAELKQYIKVLETENKKLIKNQK